MTELPGQLADPGRYLRAQRELADVSRNTLARLARVSESYLDGGHGAVRLFRLAVSLGCGPFR
jgi:hypothetical protein